MTVRLGWVIVSSVSGGSSLCATPWTDSSGKWLQLSWSRRSQPSSLCTPRVKLPKIIIYLKQVSLLLSQNFTNWYLIPYPRSSQLKKMESFCSSCDLTLPLLAELCHFQKSSLPEREEDGQVICMHSYVQDQFCAEDNCSPVFSTAVPHMFW